MIEERLDDCETNDEDIFECRVLDEDDSSKDTDDVGIAFVIKTDDGRYKCQECYKTFKSLKRFLTHMKTHNSISEENLKSLEELLTSKDRKNAELCEEVKTNSGLALFRCKACNAEFDSKRSLLLHVPMHRNSAEAHTRSSRMPTNDLYVCQLCNKTFEEEVEFELHSAASHKENNTQQLKKNIEKKVGDDSKGSHSCQFCGKIFKRPHEKVKHERVHTNEKPFACDVS